MFFWGFPVAGEFVGNGAAACGDGSHGIINDAVKVGMVKDVKRRFGGAAGDGDLFAVVGEFGRGGIVIEREGARADGRPGDDVVEFVAFEAVALASVQHRLHQAEEVGDAAAGKGGDAVDLGFIVQPGGFADGAEDGVNQHFFFGVKLAVAIDAGK